MSLYEDAAKAAYKNNHPLGASFLPWRELSEIDQHDWIKMVRPVVDLVVEQAYKLFAFDGAISSGEHAGEYPNDVVATLTDGEST